jgi:hypothetical protein
VIADLYEAVAAAGRYLLAPLVASRLPALRVRGRTARGRAGSLILVGRRAVLTALRRNILPVEMEGHELQPLSLARLSRDLARLEREADLVVVRVPRLIADLVRGGSSIVMPESVGMRASIAEIEARRRGSTSVISAERGVRRAGLAPRQSEDPRDFDLFYDSMYVPFARARFEDAAVVRSREALRRRLRKGSLFWVEQAGRPVAGYLVERQGRVLHLLIFGTDLDPVLARELGLMSAIRLFATEHAAATGAEFLDLGGSLPWLRDGSLRSKHLWGANLVRRRWSNGALLVRWASWNPTVSAFIGLAPMVRSTAKGWEALCTVPRDGPATAEAAADTARRLAVGGLARLGVIAECGWAGFGPPTTTPPLVLLEPGSSHAVQRERSARSSQAQGSHR